MTEPGLTIIERVRSRDRNLSRLEGQNVEIAGGGTRYYQESDTLEYLVHGTMDDEAVRKAVQRHAPASWHGMHWSNTRIKPVGNNGTWEVEVEYTGRICDGKPLRNLWEQEPVDEPGLPGYILASFDTTGATEQKFLSAKTTDTAGSDVADHDYCGCINVDEEGKVQGCEIVIPRLSFSVQKLLRVFTKEHLNQIATLTGKINKRPFFSFKANEVLFLGGTVQQQQDLSWVLTLNFEVDPERTIRFTDHTGENRTLHKDGWNYVWFQYEKVPPPQANPGQVVPTFVLSRPARGYSEQVYEEAEFIFP